MGIATQIEKAFHFTYKAQLDQGLTEYEFDHVYVGTYDGIISPNSVEVSDYLYLSIDEIKSRMTKNVNAFTVWFQIAFPRVAEWYQLNIVSQSR